MKKQKLSVLVLAAGEGTRMKSDIPKVLHTICGRPMLYYVLDAVNDIKPSEVAVVTGHKSDSVEDKIKKYSRNINVLRQKNQKGSGHAVMCAGSWIKRQKGNVIVVCGDTPLIKSGSLKNIVDKHFREQNAITVLTVKLDNPFGYGRVVRGFDTRVSKSVEEKDATAEEKEIKEINVGTYCFESKVLLGALKKIKPNNAKKEYYLTDVISIACEEGCRVGGLCIDNVEETLGINRKNELAKAEKVLKNRILCKLMEDGVTVVDPDSTYVDYGVRVGADTELLPGAMLRGSTVIGKKCVIGPYSFIQDTCIGDHVHIRASFLYSSQIDSEVKIGPYAHMRPGTKILRKAKVGNFVELKASKIGKNTKVSHLAYIGDSTLENDVNVGAGAVTCNFDGQNKFKTLVKKGSFIGSNVNLVAPVKIGRKVTVGAGSTISRDVPDGALALERTTQVIKKGWGKNKHKK